MENGAKSPAQAADCSKNKLVFPRAMGYNERKTDRRKRMMSISPEKLASAMALRTISHAGKEKQPCIRMADLC